MNAPVFITPWERCEGIGICDTGRYSDNKWRERIMKRHLSLGHAMASEVIRINRKHGFADSNEFLRKMDERLKLGGTGLYADMPDHKFTEYADFKSKRASQQILNIGKLFGSEGAIGAAKEICEKAGLEYPIDIKCSDSPAMVNKKHVAALARVSCAKWWRRQLRSWAARVVEQAFRVLGLVNRKGQLYVSNFTMQRRGEQKKRNNQLLLDLVAENEEGYSISLAEASELGMSNPINRRNELMVRIRGYEEIAKAMDCTGVFITLTAPSKYHAVTAGGYKNKKFNGASPRDVQDYLNGVWARVRAKWAREGIQAFGFRMVEPHHDGTPHWHQILFIKAEFVAQAMDIFEGYAIDDDKAELGTNFSPRFFAKDLHGISAAGYVAKYIAKNIDGKKEDGAGIGNDHESGQSAITTAMRVEAWASTWGIRQFQQIGSVSVTVWREIRRAKGIIEKLKEEDLLAISEACEAQDWAKFVELMGGAFVRRDDQTLRPLRELSNIENQYGEHYKRIQGVIMRGVVRVVSRWHTWVISRKGKGGGGFQYSDIEKAEIQRRAREGREHRDPLGLV